MGKGTDKLYITHAEWSSGGSYSASSGSSSLTTAGVPFRRLPYNYCAASLQPFQNAVCTRAGTIFDVEVISAWLARHGTNPVDGQPLNAKELVKLNFARAEDGSGGLVDPVTYKPFTDNTHIVAVRHGTYANVFAWDTVQRMNLKPKNLRDLVDDVEFTRADIITLQDPQNVQARDLAQFLHLQDGGTGAVQVKKKDGEANVNVDALGRLGEKVLRAKGAVERARREREDINHSTTPASAAPLLMRKPTGPLQKRAPANAAAYTTGAAAASFTSTGLTPHTSADLHVLSDEDVLLRPRKVRIKGYARIETNHGTLTLELDPEYAPKAVWNFTRLAQQGKYDGLVFHRNIPGFMLQGGDPSGTGRGGTSIWDKYFDDETTGPASHDARGVVSMANKGKNTNSSQFFITYGEAKHLDKKHTIFGRVVGGEDVLAQLEGVPTDGSDRPLNKIEMKRVVVFVDPFEEFQRIEKEESDKLVEKEQGRKRGGREDDCTTWTGKKIGRDGVVLDEEESVGEVGKYIGKTRRTVVDEEEQWEEPVKKKPKPAGFGNFDGW